MSGLGEAWRKCKVVCFDVDSTVSCDEGIDVLAEFAGRAADVAELTNRAMTGSMPFEVAMAERLKLIQPTPLMVQGCLQAHPPSTRITPGAERLVALLHERGVLVFLISGGFEDFVFPVAAALGIDRSRVIANKFLFDSDGNCAGLDSSVPTCRSGGKALAISQIQSRLAPDNRGPLAMVGDGITDLEASPPADLFVGFGGVVVRDSVARRSVYFVHSFDELSALLAEK